VKCSALSSEILANCVNMAQQRIACKIRGFVALNKLYPPQFTIGIIT